MSATQSKVLAETVTRLFDDSLGDRNNDKAVSRDEMEAIDAFYRLHNIKPSAPKLFLGLRVYIP